MTVIKESQIGGERSPLAQYILAAQKLAHITPMGGILLPLLLPRLVSADQLQEKLVPSNVVADMILYFDSPQTIECGSPIRTTEESEVRFLDKFGKLPWNELLLHQGTTEKKEQITRLQENIEVAKNIVIDGCGDKKRRTGEHVFIHPLRVFLRGFSANWEIGLDQQSTYSTTLIARVLHDAQEDFTNFKITHEVDYEYSDPQLFIDKKIGIFRVTFGDNPTGYILKMEHNEADLLQMQLNALSVPKEIDELPDGVVKSHKQIKHLLSVTKQIRKKHGPMAAYQTLRVKLDDRIDNVSTYFQMGDINPKGKLFDKLMETISFFADVEEQAKRYFSEYQKEVLDKAGTTINYPDADRYESITQFCIDLLDGGNFETAFRPNIEKAIQHLGLGAGDEIQNSWLSQFLIPTLDKHVYRTIAP